MMFSIDAHYIILITGNRDLIVSTLNSVIIHDGRHAHIIGQGRVRGPGQVEGEGLIHLRDRIAVEVEVDDLTGHPRVEAQGAVGGVIVAAGGCGQVLGGVSDRDDAGAGGAEADGEGQGLAPAVALGPGDVVDAQRGAVIVENQAQALAIGEVGVAAGPGEGEGEALIGFGRGVAEDGDGEGLAGGVGREGQVAIGGDIVTAGGGGEVLGGVIDPDLGGAGGAEGHGEGQHLAAAVAFGEAGVGNTQGGTVIVADQS